MNKKAVAASWVFVVSFVFVFLGWMVSDGKSQILDRSLSLNDLAIKLNNPDSIARYIWQNFEFEYDQQQFGSEEYWQSPEQLLNTRKGDCEDFARFASEVLKLNGVSSFLFNIYGKSYAHTVCVFKENGKYQAIDGTEVRRVNASDLTQLTSDLYPFWETGAIVAPSDKPEQGSILAQFSRRMNAHRQIETSL